MEQTYKDRLLEFGSAYEDFEAGDLLALIVQAGDRLQALCQDPFAANKALVCLHTAMGLSNVPLDGTEELPWWKNLWEGTSLSEALDLPLAQKLTGLNAYAYFGLSPASGPSTLADIKELIRSVTAAVSFKETEFTLAAGIGRTLLAARARCALDEGAALLPDELAALVRLGQKSMRNALTPSSGSGLEIKDGKITAESALNWLKARGDFKSSIWDQASEDVFSSDVSEERLEGEILWVPFASDQTEFDPVECLRNGKYTIGPKGAEAAVDNYREALDSLARMKPKAYWRRPNSAGNWGVVTAAGFRPRSAQELGIAPAGRDKQ